MSPRRAGPPRRRGTPYDLDAGKIAAVGHDVGGQLAVLLGTTAGDAALEGDGGSPGPSSAVQAVVDLAGSLSTGGLNPVSRVAKGSAPTLILHGTADAKVSTTESQALVAALKVAGVATTLDLQIAAGHDLPAAGAERRVALVDLATRVF